MPKAPPNRFHSVTYTDTEFIRALQIRTMCRKSGYDLIRSYLVDDRLPSNATIARRIAHIKAHTGVQFEMLDLIRAMPKCWQSPNCTLILDEMSIEPRVEYSRHIDALIGLPTLAPIKQNFVANNLLVF